MSENFGGYNKCKYADITDFGLVCPYAVSIIPCDTNYKFPCPDDSGTDGKRNGICYGYSAFRKEITND